MWYQLQISHCLRDKVGQLSDELENTGALAITLTDKNDDPVLEPEPGTMPLWPDVVIEALYGESKQAQEARDQLAASYPDLQLHINTVADQDWERVWMDDFKPQQFGKRLWICPSWLTPPNPDAINLILDPGLAFGTGTHATTSLCLHWLDSAKLENRTIIDYGCGSGILALAAIKLGASRVYAVDIDPQALQATGNNAEGNGIGDQQLIIDFPATLTTPVDVLIANILLAPLMTLHTDFHALLKTGGSLVVSGILTNQANDLIEAYQETFLHKQTVHSGDWALLEFTRR